MPLTISDTLSGEQTVFEPLDPEQVTLYFCGLTVSDDPHLGHARSWVHTDVIHRWLEYLGYDVRHVENFTDVNEKIVAQVGVHGDDEAAVAREMIGRTLGDMRALNLKRVDVYPRVSEHVPEIIAMVERLVDRGYAYESGGSVYFDVTTFEEYGTLSNQAIEEMESQDEGTESEKRHPQDFALWKASGVTAEEIEEHRPDDAPPADEAASRAMMFDSPWGGGRPGWHIECSAMSTTHLGETFDIHVAGRDILFPHNENEIAQSVAATDGEYARYWLHTGMLQTEGEKMSSSLQNFFRVADATERFGADVIRTFLLSTQYGTDQLYSEAAIREAAERWERLDAAYRRAVEAADSVDAVSKAPDEDLRETVDAAHDEIVAAMNDDFDTRGAFAGLLSAVTAINTHLDERTTLDYPGLYRAIETFETFGGDVLGLSFGEQAGPSVRLADELVELLLEVREREREAGNFDRADEIRAELAGLGIDVQDTDDGPTYHFEERTDH